MIALLHQQCRASCRRSLATGPRSSNLATRDDLPSPLRAAEIDGVRIGAQDRTPLASPTFIVTPC